MIVKIRECDKSYSYFEGDSVKQSRTKEIKCDELHKLSNPDTIFISSGTGEEINFLHLTLYKNHKPIQWIITNHIVYLMNNDGRTIEKLN